VTIDAVIARPADEAEAHRAAPGRRPQFVGRLGRALRRDPALLVAAALLLVPALAAMVSALRRPWYPTNDWALIELQVRNVFTGDTPLVGAWSRFDWRHPGPLPFYLLAIPYRLVPADRGLLFAAATVNLAAVAAYAGVVLRWSRGRALVALSGLALVQVGLGVEGLSDPWNPMTPIVPFALYAVLCIDLAIARHRWTLPALAFVASLVVQSHVGFAQPVVLLGVVAVALRWQLERRSRREAPPGGPDDEAPAPPWWRRAFGWVGARPAVAVAAVLVVCWLPVLVDQLFRSRNLESIVRWTFGDELSGGMGDLTQRPMGTGEGFGAAAWLLNPVGLWVGNSEPRPGFGFLLLREQSPLLLLWVPLALVAAVVVARRFGRRPPDDAWAVTVVATLAAAGAVATLSDVLSARGAPVVWPFRWAAVVVMLVFMALGWALVGALAHRRYPAAAVPALVALLVAVPVGLTVGAGSLGERPKQASSDAIARFLPAIEGHARDEGLVVANTKVLLNDIDLGLPVLLERAGIDWVERDDPRAEGHPGLYLARSTVLQDGRVAQLVDEGKVEVLAGSGPGAPGDGVDGDIVLLRAAPGVS
jgi:hypothetical protein